MIKRLRLKNFQKHSNLDIVFDPKITCILGPSDSGKSSIIRALRWIFLNKPNGDSFVKHGQKEAKVRVKVDKHTITRIKGKENLYLLDDQKFSSFGTTVPEPIQKITAIEDHNFQCQYDSPFWFSETSGEISRQLNSIVNLEIIDKAQSYLSSRIREQKAIQQHLSKQVETLQNTIENLRVFEQIDEELRIIEEKQDNLKKAIKNIAKIKLLIEQAEAQQQFRQKYKKILPYIHNLDNLVTHYKKIEDQIKKLSTCLVKWEKYEPLIRVKIPSINNLETLYNKRTILQQKIIRLNEMVSRLENLTIQENQCKTRKIALENQLNTMIGDRCPLCGQRIRLPFSVPICTYH